MKRIAKRLFAGILTFVMAFSLMPQMESKAASYAAQIDFSDGRTENYATMEEAIAAVNAMEVTEECKGGTFTAYADIPVDSSVITLAGNSDWTFAFGEHGLYSEIEVEDGGKIHVVSGSILESGFINLWTKHSEIDIADGVKVDDDSANWIGRYLKYNQHCKLISREDEEDIWSSSLYEVETLEDDNLPYRVGENHYADPNVALQNMQDNDTLYIEADVEDNLFYDSQQVKTFSLDATDHTFSGILEAGFNITFVAGTFDGAITYWASPKKIYHVNDGVRFVEDISYFPRMAISDDQTLRLVDGYYVTTSEITDEDYAFEMAGKKYMFFERLISEATSGATITALKDCNESISVPFNADVKLDFGTHTFSGELWNFGKCEIIGGNFVGEYDEENDECSAWIVGFMSLDVENCHPVVISGGYFKDIDFFVDGIKDEELPDLVANEDFYLIKVKGGTFDADYVYPFFVEDMEAENEEDRFSYILPGYMSNYNEEDNTYTIDPIKYNVTFDKNSTDVTNDFSDWEDCNYGEEYVLPSGEQVRPGYDVVWNTQADGNGTSYNPGDSIGNLTTENGDTVTFYAIWNIHEYTISYNLNGGKIGAENPTTYNVNTDTIVFKNPTKNGYSFDGWYTDSAYKTKVTQIAKGTTGNKKLYAKWTPVKYTISYELNQGVNSKKNPTSYTIETNTITLDKPSREGWDFDGWYSDSAFKTKVTQIAKGTTGNKKLYAKWTPVQYKISYQLNGGKNSKKNPATYSVTSGKITLADPTKKGYTFKGWYSDSKFKNRIKDIAAGSIGNKTVYAKWSVNQYKISYKLNGGKNSKKNPKKYTVDSKTITLAKPTRKGYSFKGWYSDKKFKKKVTKISKGSTGNVTLYAKWVKNK